MTKARTTAAKRRAKRERRPISLANGETAANPARGTDRRGTNAPEDAASVALQARARIFGGKVTQEAQSACKAALAGCDMGRCLLSLHPLAADHLPLWDVWQAMGAAQANYRARILGTSGQPQGAAIAMIPEPMQTDTGHTVDIRTAEERDAAAKAAQAYWARMLAALPSPQHRWALRPAMDAVEGALWRDCAPTARGRVAVQALVLLAGMHGGKG